MPPDDRINHRRGELFLHGEIIVRFRSNVSDQIVRPEGPSTSVAEDTLSRCPFATQCTIENRGRAKALGNRRGSSALPLKRERRAAADDRKPWHPPEPVDEFLRESVREILLRRIAAQVGEGQYGDGRSVGRRRLGESDCRTTSAATVASSTPMIATSA